MKIKVFALLVLFILSNKIFAQDFHWRWSRSTFDVSPEANLAHFVGTGFLADFYERKGLVWWQADLAAFWTGFAWEVKDGYLHYSIIPVIGSDGFSKMDISINILGLFSNRIFNFALKKVFKMNKKQKKPHEPGRFYY